MAVKNRTILLVGIGNTLRGDDGIGAYICARIDSLGLQGVKTLIVQQLHTELAEEFVQYDHIILADASVTATSLDFYPLQKGVPPAASSSHHVNAGLLLALSEKLYQKELSVMICAVRAENFDMGEQLSDTAKHHAEIAVTTIRNWIEAG